MVAGLPCAVEDAFERYSRDGDEFALQSDWGDLGVSDFSINPCRKDGMDYARELRKRGLPGVIAALERICEERGIE